MGHKIKSMPSKEELIKLFNFDADTGRLIWKPRPRDMFVSNRSYATWNAKFAGKFACDIANFGYYRVSINNIRYQAHRVIWVMHYGEIEGELEIDHKNGIREDNRLCNLRCVTRRENGKNLGSKRNNSLGYRGIVYHKLSNTYNARITVDGKVKSLGYYKTPESAYAVYLEAAEFYNFSNRHMESV